MAFTIPNIITCSRILLSPVLILLALAGERTIFLIVFALTLSTDALDGYLARKLSQASEFGTKLDSWADVAMWISALICLFILWPDLAKREGAYAAIAMTAFILPMIIGFLKYKQVPCYHCYSAKFQVIFIGATAFLLIFTNIAWPFRCAALLQVLVALEDISITMLLPKPHYNIPSVWQAIKLARQS